MKVDLGPVDSKRLHGNAPIGYAITGNELYIVKSSKSINSQQDGESDELELFEMVPDGTAGELLVGGTQLAAGYHNRDKETAQRFISHNRIIFRNIPNEDESGISGSGSSIDGKKLFRTGDIVVKIPISMGNANPLPDIPFTDADNNNNNNDNSSVADRCESILNRGEEWCNKWAGSILWLGRSDLQVRIREERRYITSRTRYIPPSL